MDFSFDGGFQKFSSFKVDMSDLDFSSPSRKGQKTKESKAKQSEPEKVEQASESFTFNFDFNELDGFDLSSSLSEKNGDSGKHSLDTSSDSSVKHDQSVRSKLPNSVVLTPENNENDDHRNLCNKPMDKRTVPSGIIVEVDKGSSSYEKSPKSPDAIGDISLKTEADVLASREGPEKTGKLEEELGSKCSKEMKSPQSIKDSSHGSVCGNDSIHQTLQFSDIGGDHGPSSGKECSAIKGSSCLPSMQESMKSFPSHLRSVGRSEKFETVKELFVGKCSMELESPQTLLNSSPKGIHQNDRVHDTGPLDYVINARPAGEINGKQDPLMKKSAGSVLKTSTSSLLESLKHFPSKGATEAKSIKRFLDIPVVDVQGPKAVGQSKTEVEKSVAPDRQKIQANGEPFSITELNSVRAKFNKQKEASGKSSPYFLQKTAPKQICSSNEKSGIIQGLQNIDENSENTLQSSPRAEKSMSSLPEHDKYEKNCHTVGRAFSLFSRVKLNKELMTDPRADTGGTPDLKAALVHTPKQKESSSMLTNYYQCASRHVELATNYKTIGIKEAKVSVSENEKRPRSLSTLKLSRTLTTNGGEHVSKVQKEPKVDLKAPLKKAKTSIPEMAMSSSLYLKRKSLQGPSMRELTKSPLKHVIESPQIESRKRQRDSQIIEQKQVLDTVNVQPFSKDARHDLLSTPSISTETSTPDMEISTPMEDGSTIQKAEAYAKEIEDMCHKLTKMNEEAKELLVRAVVNNNFLLLLNHPKFEKKISLKNSIYKFWIVIYKHILVSQIFNT
ncbi:uncharacterized protein At4g18490 [Nymphaea colorata]|uniref:uncharacterized protein At4g18490 n=1 Tax=Nymphaea colorata TaxID=210225 RepID=UPI00214F0284|nr:uncharacterized protein At4g18490 [Nymphaea colorata]